MAGTATTLTPRKAPRTITRPVLLALATAFAMLEGYDLVCYGVTVPSLLADPAMGLEPGTAGLIGTLTVTGMLVGAAVAGATVDRLGSRRLLLASVGVFSLGMLLSALAPDAALLVVGRSLVGIGLGVTLPTLLSYVADLSDPERRSRHVGLVMSGYALGGLLAPLLGAAILPAASFRWIFAIGLVPAVVALPLALRLFPPTPVHLLRTGRPDEARTLAAALGVPLPAVDPGAKRQGLGLRPLFTRTTWLATIMLWLTSACGLLLVFAVGTWLPTIMQSAGYDLGPALLLTAALWTGAGVGMIVGGRVADAVGPKPIVAIAFLLGAVSLVLMAARPGTAVLVVLMFVGGFGLIGSQALVTAYVLSRYPEDVRSSGLSWALAAGRPGGMVGPLLGAWVLTSGLAFQWNFYVFAVVGVLGALFALLVPRVRRDRPAAPAA